MTTPPAAAGRRSGRRSAGFGSRLLAAQAIVVVGGAISAWLVAAAVAPGLFHNHLQTKGGRRQPPAPIRAAKWIAFSPGRDPRRGPVVGRQAAGPVLLSSCA